MKEYTLPRQTLWLWRIRLTAAALVLTLLVCRLGALLPVRWPAALLLALLWAATTLLFFGYLPRLHRSCRICWNEESLLFQRGVFLHTQTLLPAPRMVYAELYSTPLARAMGLSGLALQAARAALWLPPLLRRDAAALLLALGGGDDA